LNDRQFRQAGQTVLAGQGFDVNEADLVKQQALALNGTA
jgi:hypothetical protein